MIADIVMIIKASVYINIYTCAPFVYIVPSFLTANVTTHLNMNTNFGTKTALAIGIENWLNFQMLGFLRVGRVLLRIEAFYCDVEDIWHITRC